VGLLIVSAFMVKKDKEVVIEDSNN
jgi:hypothetical protein